MNPLPIDHVGIAVPVLDDALPTWEAITGAAPTGRETISSQGVEVVFLDTGSTSIELIAPSHPESPLTRFLERRGSGLHHIAYRVPDIRRALAGFAASGFDLIDSEPRRGARNHLVAFLHPRTSGGVLVELVEARE